MPWYSDLTKAIEEKIISPAREIFEKNIVLSPEEQEVYTSTHKNKTSQLGKTVSFLQDDFNMTEGKTNKNIWQPPADHLKEEQLPGLSKNT